MSVITCGACGGHSFFFFFSFFSFLFKLLTDLLVYPRTEYCVNLLVILVGSFTDVLCPNERLNYLPVFFKRELKVSGSCEFVREPEFCCSFYVLFLTIDYVADLKA